MKALVVIENGSEDTELVCACDLFKRAGMEVEFVSNSTKEVFLSHGFKAYETISLENINIDLFDLIYIPGGKKGVELIKNNSRTIELIQKFYNKEKLVCAICAAPVVLEKAGILKNHEYTCYDGFENEIESGIYIKKEGVVKSDNIITGRSLNYTIDFALMIIQNLLGDEIKEKVRKGILKEE